MLTNVKIATIILLCLAGMFGFVYHQKKQFYPTVVYLSKSGAAVAICYVEALILALIVSTVLRKIFFGDLRPIESERLAERSWYALTETCLAFTIFKDDTIPVFVFLFALLIFMKTFHWLADERVDLIERSVIISNVFHVRIIAVFLLLGAIDVSLIIYAAQLTMRGGPSIQIVFGFEYCILLVMLLDNFIKYILYLHGLFEQSTPENRAITQMYVTVVINSFKVALYSAFFFLMVQIFTFPLFVLRPMFLTVKAFKKSVMNVRMTHRALKYLNNFYPDATPLDLQMHDNACIICREELTAASKKLPCNHIFHTACLRAWFQRQQTCPTCRYSILQVPQSVQLERLRTSRSVHVGTQTESSASEESNSCRSGFIFHSRHFIHPQSLANLTEEELSNEENQKKEMLQRSIRKLSELSYILDEAASAIQELPSCFPRTHECSSEMSKQLSDINHIEGEEGQSGCSVNLKMIREKRIHSLIKTQPGDDTPSNQ